MPRQLDTARLTIHDVALTSMCESTRSIVNSLSASTSASASDDACHKCSVGVKTFLRQRLDTASDIVSGLSCPLLLGLERLHCLDYCQIKNYESARAYILAMLAFIVPPTTGDFASLLDENLSDPQVHTIVGDESGIVSCKPP